MATQERGQACKELVRKLTTGVGLVDAERSHIAVCESCMAEVVKTLDEAAGREPHGLNMAVGGSNGDFSQARTDAKKALEQGRRVFEREFGISLSKK